MQLKLQRSQRQRGTFSGTVYFCLDVRADYSAEEQDNIRKYRLGNQVIYNSQAAKKHLETAGAHLERTQWGSVGERAAGLARGALSLALAKMNLNISIASLGRGHHIECKDLEELLEAEDTVRNACKNLTRYLEVANTFDGSEIVIEYDNGEEKIHIGGFAPPLLEYAPESAPSAPTVVDATYEDASGGYTGERFDPDALWKEAAWLWARVVAFAKALWQRLEALIEKLKPLLARYWSLVREKVEAMRRKFAQPEL